MDSQRRYIIEPYEAQYATEWDHFVDTSRNATFLLKRGYMDYHSDRFDDCSLLVYRCDGENRRLVSVFAACVGKSPDVVSAHAGLTYGGLVLPFSGIGGDEVVDIMQQIVDHYRACGFARLIYKAIPHIYHRYPAEEDLYALFRLRAKLIETNLSAAISLAGPLPFNENARRNKRRASQAGVIIEQTGDFQSFWTILDGVLAERYNTRPVHTVDEMILLASRFPDNIRLVVARNAQGSVIAGTVLYITSSCVHTQYIAASAEGKALGALPLVFDEVISKYCGTACFLDFGISNEDHGRYLNEGLLRQKYGMGARGIVYNIFELEV